jgi:P2 family phage contractile tail tube protein
VEGIGFISNSASAELPKIEFEAFEAKSGMAVHSVTTTVLKKMEAKFELNEVNQVYFAAMSKRQNEKAVFWVKSNTNLNATDRRVTVTLKGHIQTLEFPKGEFGKEAKSTLQVAVDFFKYEQDEQTLLLIDIENLVCEINGEDIWASQREFLVG